MTEGRRFGTPGVLHAWGHTLTAPGLSHDFHQQEFTATVDAARANDPRLAETEIQLASDGLRVPLTL